MTTETPREHLNTARQLIEIARPLVGVSTRAAVELRELLAAIDRRIVRALDGMCPHDVRGHCVTCYGPDAYRETMEGRR